MTQKRLRERYITSSIYGRGTQKWVKPEGKKNSGYFCIFILLDDEKCDSSSALNAIARFAGTTNVGSKSLPAKELKFTLLRDPTIGHQQVISKLKKCFIDLFIGYSKLFKISSFDAYFG